MGGIYILPDDDSSIIIQPDTTISETHENTVTITDHPVEEGVNISDHVRVENRRFSCQVYITRTPITDQRPIRANATDKVDPTEGLGTIDQAQLDVPVYNPPFDGTPGAIFRAAGGLLGRALDLITGGPKATTAYALLLFPEAFDPVLSFQTALEEIQNRGQTVTVVTTTLTYESMLIETISAPITEAGGAEFALTFRAIRVVSSTTVKAPKPSIPAGAPNANKGGQATKPTDGAGDQKSTSLAKKILNSLGITTPGT